MLLSIITSPRKISQRLSFLGRFFSKPQQKIIKGLVVGLLAIEKPTVTKIAQTVKLLPTQSAVSKALHSDAWSGQDVMDALSKHYAKRTKNSGRLILDDTLGRKYTKKAEYSHYLYDHSKDESYWAFNANLCQYSDDEKFFFVDFTLYDKKKTKLETAEEMIKRAIKNGIKFKKVITDSWYFDNNLINAIVGEKRQWLGQVKSHYTFRYGNKWIKVGEYKKLIDPKELKKIKTGAGKKYYIIERRVIFKAIDKPIKLVFSRKNRFSGEYKLFGTTEIDLDQLEVINEYEYRWNIEPSIEDMKEHVGFKDFQGNKTIGLEKYIAMVLLGYSVLSEGVIKRDEYTLGDYIRDLWKELLEALVKRFMKGVRFMLENPQCTDRSIDFTSYFFLT